MPQFLLNADNAPVAYDNLNDFAKGYVEALFFTNGDTGEEDEFLLNDLGVEALNDEILVKIAQRCERFWNENESNLEKAKQLEPGSDEFKYGREKLDDTRLGHLFWYASQGHGVGFTDDGDAQCLQDLQEASRKFGEFYVWCDGETIGCD